MTLALIALAVLAVVIFAFVLEPVLRARGDRVVLDAAALPEHHDGLTIDEADVAAPERQPGTVTDTDERQGGRRVTIERSAGSDAS
ncbi:MAG: hypothetical protein WEC79_05580 [Thermomicrobiales bacterium]